MKSDPNDQLHASNPRNGKDQELHDSDEDKLQHETSKSESDNQSQQLSALEKDYENNPVANELRGIRDEIRKGRNPVVGAHAVAVPAVISLIVEVMAEQPTPENILKLLLKVVALFAPVAVLNTAYRLDVKQKLYVVIAKLTAEAVGYVGLAAVIFILFMLIA